SADRVFTVRDHVDRASDGEPATEGGQVALVFLAPRRRTAGRCQFRNPPALYLERSIWSNIDCDLAGQQPPRLCRLPATEQHRPRQPDGDSRHDTGAWD